MLLVFLFGICVNSSPKSILLGFHCTSAGFVIIFSTETCPITGWEPLMPCLSIMMSCLSLLDFKIFDAFLFSLDVYELEKP